MSKQVSNNFQIHEFVPGHIFERWGDRSVWFVQPRIISVAQAIREHFGKSVMINGNGMNFRGFRDDSFYFNEDGSKKRKGGFFSQHRFGNAIDLNVSGMDCDEVRDEIIKHTSKFMDAGLTTLEDGAFAPTWVHCDARPTGMNEILIVKP